MAGLRGGGRDRTGDARASSAEAPADGRIRKLDYWGRPVPDAPGAPDRPEPTLDQDDVAAGVMALLLLALLGWVAWGFLGPAAEEKDGRNLAPQSAAVEPSAPESAPAAPEFGDPIDLTPRSAPPGPAPEAPAPIPAAAQPDTRLALGAQPQSAAAPDLAPTCDPARVLRAYFCTARSELTPGVQAALETGLAEMGACAEGREWIVRGFADTRGQSAANIALARRRAAAVAAVLEARGLTVAEVSGVGETEGLQDGVACPTQRRVDVSLKSAQPPLHRACAPAPTEEELICP